MRRFLLILAALAAPGVLPGCAVTPEAAFASGPALEADVDDDWLLDLARALFAGAPPAEAVYLRVLPEWPEEWADLLGWTAWNPLAGRYDVVVNGRLPRPLVEAVIVHELAHVLADDAGGHAGEGCYVDDHGPYWGVAYSQVYRAYERWVREKNEGRSPCAGGVE